MLEIKNISKTFNKGTINEKVALNDLSITINDGDFITVIGGNGAGKSTMLNAICGTIIVDEGSIILDDKDITKLGEAKKAKNWAEADRIRDELKARGIEIIDTPQGAKWRKV